MSESTRAALLGILALALFLISETLLAQPSFYDERAQGWHWYETQISSELIEQEDTQVISPERAVQELNALQQELEGAKALAVMYPTPSHVERYISLHNTVIERASLFSNVWQQVIWQMPDLNFSIDNPTDNSARYVYYDLQQTVQTKNIASLADEYGLFFFFRESCPYCHEFAPVLKNVADRYEITIMAVSLDGGTLPEFPQAIADNGLAQELGVEVVPAVYALHPQSQQVIPISFGFVSEAELIRRMSALAEHHGVS